MDALGVRAAVLVFLVPAVAIQVLGAVATGPLRVHQTNPRYFADGSGRAILLAGSHTWTNLQDLGPTDPPQVTDYDAFLAMLESYGHNFMRLWMYETAKYAPWAQGDYYYYPLPYARTGPGNALDGKPKFDLTRFNQDYFDRMRARVIAARDKGIYCAIMLFQGWSVDSKGQTNPWPGHPFNKDNNINGIDGDANQDGSGNDIHTLANPAVTALQELYVRKVVDTVNDLPNVLYEIGNEHHGASEQWQYHMINYLHTYEATKPFQHPVGMTVEWPNGSNADLFASPAEWVSPNGEGGYQDNPPPATGAKVILSDTDHLWGVGGDRVWAWKSFTRGLNPIYMDPYLGTVLGTPPNAPSVRQALGHILSYASKVELAAMTPQGALATSGYCLANAAAYGAEYIVYLPSGGTVTVDLSATPGNLAVEWFNCSTGERVDGGAVAGGTGRSFAAPFAGDAVLYLKGPEDPTIPVAVAAASPNPAVVNEPVAFDGSGSHDPSGGRIVDYAWDFDGDGNPDVSGADKAQVNHVYASIGTYTVRLTVTDDEAKQGFVTLVVTVTGPPQLTSINVSPPGAWITPGGAVQLTASPKDQNGVAFAAPISWTVSGGGRVSPAASGGAVTQHSTVFVSDGAAGEFTVTASSGAVQKAIVVRVAQDPPVHLRINCGANSLTPAGWQDDDAYVSGGEDYTFSGTFDTAGVANAAPAEVYKTVRHLDHAYNFPSVPDGVYVVRLHLGDGFVSDRRMDYTFEGQKLVDDLDIAAEAGGTYKALVKELSVAVADGNGLQIVASKDLGNDVFEGGIEIISSLAPAAEPPPDGGGRASSRGCGAAPPDGGGAALLAGLASVLSRRRRPGPGDATRR